MKTFICIWLLFKVCPLLAQPGVEKNLHPVKVEWKREFPAQKTETSGLLVYGQRIYLTQTGGASIFNTLDINGVITFSAPVENTRIRNLQKVNGSFFTVGDHHLSTRDLTGQLTSEKELFWINNSWIHMVNGEIYNNKLYTTNSSRDFVVFNLLGEQLMRKELGNTVINQRLQAKTQNIYLYSIFQDPPAGGQLMQYDTLGNQKWSISPGGFVSNIVADNEGNCYTFMVIPQKSNVVKKYDAEGKIMWSQTVPGQSIVNGSLYGDTLFVCGMESIESANGQLQNPAYSAISAVNGEVFWQQTFNFYDGEEGSNEHFTHVVCDGNALYLGGTTGGQTKKCFLVKLSEEGNTTGHNDDKNPRTGFNIFPNPGGSKFTITCSEPATGLLKITVRNGLGQVIKEKHLACEGKNSWDLDLGKQPPGNYSVELEAGNEKVIRKLIVE